MCRVSARRLGIYNFVLGLKANKKVYLYPKKEKKNTYGIHPTKFTSSIQKHKKVIETPNQPIEIKKISNKSILSTAKVKRRQKFIWRLPDGVCRLNPKS
jgi:hypothetical protein